MRRRRIAPLVAFAALFAAAPAGALGTTSDYLLIGTGDADVAGATIAISNFEVGANLESVPMPGLTLVEPIPPGTLPVPTGITGDGDMAITDTGGRYEFANLAIRGVFGLRCAAPGSTCNDGVSATTFNGQPFPDFGFTGGVAFPGVLAELADARSAIPRSPATSSSTSREETGTWPASTCRRASPSTTSTRAATISCCRTATW